MTLKRQNLVVLASILIAVLGFLTLTYFTPKVERTQWNHTYSIGVNACPYSIKQTQDGGYIIAGRTVKNPNGNTQIFLLKTDLNGKPEWDKTYYENWSQAYTVQITKDGGYIVGGYCDSFIVFKTNSTGDIQWSIKKGRIDSYANSILLSEDGGYVISEPLGGNWVSLVKMDAGGQIIWNKTLGNQRLPFSTIDSSNDAFKETPDGGYIIVGGTVFDDKGVSVGKNGLVVLIKTDSNGNMIWNGTYGGSFFDRSTSLQLALDGGYVMAGYTLPPLDTGYIFKTDLIGNMMWNRTYGDDLSCRALLAESNGGFIVAGSNSTDVGLVGVVFEIDESGHLQKSVTLGDYYVSCNTIHGTIDGGYVIAGGTNDDKMFIIKR